MDDLVAGVMTVVPVVDDVRLVLVLVVVAPSNIDSNAVFMRGQTWPATMDAPISATPVSE